jgi:hypothetical protein
MATRRRKKAAVKPPHSIRQILAWCDAYHRKWGRWPKRNSGPVDGTAGEKWSAVDAALHFGHRGLTPGGSLIKLLAEKRGYRHRNYLPRLTIRQILAWADAHRRRAGEWPTGESGPVADAPGETWNGIDLALQRGTRVRRGGVTLAGLLAARRGVRHRAGLPDLTVEQILAWADAHHTLFGVWPTQNAGPVGSTGETWRTIDKALRQGGRDLSGGSSLFRLLKEHGRFAGTCTPFRRRRPSPPPA